MTDDLRALWNEQPEEGAPMSVEEVKKRSTTFARAIAFRNAREALAAGAVMAGFALIGGRAEGKIITRLACALIVIAAGFVSFTLRRRGRVAAGPPIDAPTADHVAHLRGELEQQRDLLSRVARWYLSPFAPGLLLYFVGIAFEELAGSPLAMRLLVLLGGLGVTGVVFAVVVIVNRRAVRKLAAEIDALRVA